jgi:hypothetical protein
MIENSYVSDPHQVMPFVFKTETYGNRMTLTHSCHFSESHDAMLYKITITIGRKIMHYIGYHGRSKKNPLEPLLDDFPVKYIHSSKNPELIADFANPDSTIVYGIIASGTIQEMKQLEYQELAKVDAVNNVHYYNKSNGGGKGVKKIVTDSCRQILNEICTKIKNDTYDKTFILKNELKTIPRVQVRMEKIDIDHVNDLKEIMYKNGSNTFIAHALLYNNGKRELIGGIHTTEGIIQVNTERGLSVMDIPEEDFKLLNKSSLHELGLRLNKGPAIKQKENSNDDLANQVLMKIEEHGLYTSEGNPDIHHPIIKDTMDGLGILKGKRKTIFKIVASNAVTQKALSLGQNLINWELKKVDLLNLKNRTWAEDDPEAFQKNYLSRVITDIQEKHGKDTIFVKASPAAYFFKSVEKIYLKNGVINEGQPLRGQPGFDPIKHKAPKIAMIYYNPTDMFYDDKAQDKAKEVITNFDAMYKNIHEPACLFQIVSVTYLPKTTQELNA